MLILSLNKFLSIIVVKILIEVDEESFVLLGIFLKNKILKLLFIL